MSSRSRFREQGLVLEDDRLTFLRPVVRVVPPYGTTPNFDVVRGSLVAHGEVSIGGDLTVTPPAHLRNLNVSLGSYFQTFQTIEIPAQTAPQSVYFRAPITGSIIYMHAVLWEDTVAGGVVFRLRNAGGLEAEQTLNFTDPPYSDPGETGSVEFLLHAGTNSRSVCMVTKGDLRYIRVQPQVLFNSRYTVVLALEGHIYNN